MKIKFYKKYNWRDYWQTLEDEYFTTLHGTIKVPSNFVLDFGSLPRFAWFLSAPLTAPYFYYYCLHDYFYSNLYTWKVTRKEADYIFYLQIKKYSIIKAVIFYIAVRLFGWKSFNKPLPFKKYE